MSIPSLPLTSGVMTKYRRRHVLCFSPSFVSHPVLMLPGRTMVFSDCVAALARLCVPVAGIAHAAATVLCADERICARALTWPEGFLGIRAAPAFCTCRPRKTVPTTGSHRGSVVNMRTSSKKFSPTLYRGELCMYAALDAEAMVACTLSGILCVGF
jgi:hypothetical protein